MGQIYSVSVDGLATGTALKTILQIATPSGVRAKITEVGVTFDGTTASNTPVLVTLRRQTSAGTGGASITSNFGPNPHNPDAPTANITAQQGPTGTWTAEPTTGKVLRAWRIPPTSGFIFQFPLGQEIEMAVSQWLGIVVTAANAVNCTASITWEE
jgi:hypothetical protein